MAKLRKTVYLCNKSTATYVQFYVFRAAMIVQFIQKAVEKPHYH